MHHFYIADNNAVFYVLRKLKTSDSVHLNVGNLIQMCVRSTWCLCQMMHVESIKINVDSPKRILTVSHRKRPQ